MHKRRPVTKKDVADLKRKINKLEKELKELKQSFYEYTSEPMRAVLDFFGLGVGEKVFTKSGVGVEYEKIIEKLHNSEEGEA